MSFVGCVCLYWFGCCWLCYIYRQTGPNKPNAPRARRVTRFNGVHSLDLHFPSNHAGGGATHISFIGLKGEFSERQRRAVDAVYEARPVPKDHAVPGGEAGGGWNVGM